MFCSSVSLVSTRRPSLISALSSGDMEDWDQNGSCSALAHEGMKIVTYLEEEEDDAAEAERGQERKKVTVSNVPKDDPDVPDWLQTSESVSIRWKHDTHSSSKEFLLETLELGAKTGQWFQHGPFITWSRTSLIQGDPPADGRMGKGGERAGGRAERGGDTHSMTIV